MRSLRMSLPLSVCIMFLLLFACTSTKFSSVWKDPSYQEHPAKIMVVSAFKDPGTRRLFEDEFVRALKDRGVDAVVSYTIMSDPIVFADRDLIAAQATSLGADTVLVNTPLGTRADEVGSPWGIYSYEDVYISTQTEVYDKTSNRLIFKVSSETWIRQDATSSRNIRSYINTLLNKLSRSGLF